MQSVSIDVSGLTQVQIQTLLWEASRLKKAAEMEAFDWRHFFETAEEREIIEMASREFCPGSIPPMVLANSYKEIHQSQELLWMGGTRHPRRPVLMRGCKIVMKRIFSRGSHTAYGYAEEVLFRWKRLMKITAFSSQEYNESLASCVSRLSYKYNLHYQFRKYAQMPRSLFEVNPRTGVVEICLNGKLLEVTRSERENIMAMHKIIKKTDKIEERMKLARAHMKARLQGN